MKPSFMIIPSLSCQAACKYCFGPHRGAVMDIRTAEETARFVRRIARECGMETADVTFHGGEPLLAPVEVWEALLSGMADGKGMEDAGDVQFRFSVQSNLWNLNDAFMELFGRYHVEVGTSLDGPRELCDRNRGEGYFDQTMASVRRLETAGRHVGMIATLTRETLPHAEEVLAFFRDRGTSPVLHCAVRGIDTQDRGYALTAEEYSEGIIRLFPWYINNRKYMSIPTLDHFCKGLAYGEPQVCTMGDCLGMFLAVSPTGDVTPCQRMAGKPAYSMGNIFDHPTLEELFTSKAARRLRERQERVTEQCADCAYIDICRGGCYYNAIASGDGVRDPLCEAYRRIYAFVEDRFKEEVGAEENLQAMDERPARPDEHPLLRRGPYISLADRVHPSAVADTARQILAAHALAKAGDVQRAAEDLVARGICGDPAGTVRSLEHMQSTLREDHRRLNNCYFHVTFRCNLRCTHCYASAGESADEMPVRDLAALAEEAIGRRFRQLIITGGEPLQHRERDALLELCTSLRGRGSNLVLRTNLTGDFSDEVLERIARAFDQVVVSIDGNEQTHDRRRGEGTYRNAVANCERYAAIAGQVPNAGELSLACVMNAEAINGAPGDSVRELGDRLGVRRVRFRPLLPLGRAADMDEPVICEGIRQHELPRDKLRSPFRPLVTCGIGQNVYLCPDGRAYPCYAWQTADSFLGNVITEGLGSILDGPQFTRLRHCTVDTIDRCRTCEYRYLCGGACRAWGNQHEKDPNTAPPECGHLQRNAQALLDAAYRELMGK